MIYHLTPKAIKKKLSKTRNKFVLHKTIPLIWGQQHLEACVMGTLFAGLLFFCMFRQSWNLQKVGNPLKTRNTRHLKVSENVIWSITLWIKLDVKQSNTSFFLLLKYLFLKLILTHSTTYSDQLSNAINFLANNHKLRKMSK